MKKMRPEQINDIAGNLLTSYAFLKSVVQDHVADGHPFPFTLLKVSAKTPDVKWLQYRGHAPGFSQGALFGWLYVCFVWLQEADKELFERAVRDERFVKIQTPFLSDRLIIWDDRKPRTLDSMLWQFRHAIAHGNIYLNVDESVENGDPPRIFLTSYDTKKKSVVRAQFCASFTDLIEFGEAVYHAHQAAVRGVPYGTVFEPPGVYQVEPPERIPTRNE